MENSSTLRLRSKRLWLLLPICLALLTVMLWGWLRWDRNAALLSGTEDEIRKRLESMFPPGSDITEAERILTSKGFKCYRTPTPNGWWLSAEGSKSAGWPVMREYHIHITQRTNRVLTVHVITDLVGP